MQTTLSIVLIIVIALDIFERRFSFPPDEDVDDADDSDEVDEPKEQVHDVGYYYDGWLEDGFIPLDPSEVITIQNM